MPLANLPRGPVVEVIRADRKGRFFPVAELMHVKGYAPEMLQHT